MTKTIYALAFILVISLTNTAHADPAPGSACSPNNAVTHSGGPENSGNAYWMVCQGGTWTSIISTDANGMASTNTPTAAAHIATKGYVDAQAAGSLNVYKFDGVTLVGKLINAPINSRYYSASDNTITGSLANGCVGLTIMEPAGTVRTLTGLECGASYPGDSAYFSGTNCTGTVANPYGNAAYTCTGSATCNTGVRAFRNIVYTVFNYQSARNNGGVCSNYSSDFYSSFGIYSYYTPIAPSNAIVCGSDFGNLGEYCKVKP